jgi:hypothetical protein
MAHVPDEPCGDDDWFGRRYDCNGRRFGRLRDWMAEGLDGGAIEHDVLIVPGEIGWHGGVGYDRC